MHSSPQTSAASKAVSLALLPTFVVGFAVGLAPLAGAPALAQTSAPAPAQSGPYWAVVKGDDVMLRSGASVQSHYPFGRLHTGMPLKVIERQYGWAKVAAVGPTFEQLFGYVRAESATSFDPRTNTLSVVGRTGILAPSMEGNWDPDKSWRQIASLDAGDSLAVLEVVQGQRDTFYKVRLPEKAEGWVNEQFIVAASPDEVAQIERALASGGTSPSGASRAAVPPPPEPEVESGMAGDVAVETSETVVEEVATTQAPIQPAETPAAPAAVTNPPATEPVANDPMVEAIAAAQARAQAEQLRRVTYQDLEMIWSRMRNEPTESAELDALRERYLSLASDPETLSATRQMANSRAEQIAMRIEVQQRILELADRQARLVNQERGIANLELAVMTRRPFDAVGRLNASTVYNGERLPLLYKLADPTTGFTVAYLIPNPGSNSTKLSESLGLVVGIKGQRRYDDTLRVNVITPEMIEALDTQATAVVIPD